ncbi:TetR family transcriptional regulator [Actinoplanes sp. SE50]|uniref:TetR/AcrR family transcriptional regulator n=1 Tax=unclassified Actinoplanes TaxID=2626549 RepID=UPI00023ED057|nr:MULTISPECIES: TetR family transcriptional regulator [unclassified Actinoplanes]AEV83861.1 HTH-type transcriptional regulator betI [Actinoplanes sp. SE50/110]ATO81995.1 TetR family transcriptional regulator [Actinoplanes sp. SE50]SLL99403.1 TetR family transcriptional regulator [Actinoplanes sp. SE50/110]
MTERRPRPTESRAASEPRDPGTRAALEPRDPETRAGLEPRDPETRAGLESRDPETRAAAERRPQRPRDPEARRAALAAATMEIIAEAGVGRTTHRAVAARAGLPLGATTYYFPTLDDLIAAGLRYSCDAMRADLDVWSTRLAAAPDMPAELTALTAEYLQDRRQVRIEYELCMAAARDARLRALAETWMDGLPEILHPWVGEPAARDICALLDGIILRALVTETELDAPGLTAAIRRLIPPA